MQRRTLLAVLLGVVIGATGLAITGSRVHGLGSYSSATNQSARSPNPMILQQNDGEAFVHRSGPLTGVPFTIKLDGQFGNSEDFFVFAEILAPGQTIPFHMHENAEELLMFQEAGAEVMVGDKRGPAGPQSIIFIPRNTWISATNKSGKPLHTTAVFSRHGFDTYMRAIGAKPGERLNPQTQDELTRLRSAGQAMYWDISKGPFPPGVNHP